MRVLTLGAHALRLAVVAALAALADVSAAQEPDCSVVYLGDIDADMADAKAAAERATHELEEATDAAELGQRHLARVEEQAAAADHELDAARTAATTAGDVFEEVQAELREANAEADLDEVARDLERATRRAATLRREEASARARLEESNERIRELEDIVQRNEACSDPPPPKGTRREVAWAIGLEESDLATPVADTRLEAARAALDHAAQALETAATPSWYYRRESGGMTYSAAGGSATVLELSCTGNGPLARLIRINGFTFRESTIEATWDENDTETLSFHRLGPNALMAVPGLEDGYKRGHMPDFFERLSSHSALVLRTDSRSASRNTFDIGGAEAILALCVALDNYLAASAATGPGGGR